MKITRQQAGSPPRDQTVEHVCGDREVVGIDPGLNVLVGRPRFVQHHGVARKHIGGIVAIPAPTGRAAALA